MARRPPGWACGLLLLTAGCYVNVDAEPRFELVQITSPGPGEMVRGGTQFDLRLEGQQLWGRIARIDVVRTSPEGREVVDMFTTQFDESPHLQTASAEWVLDGDFLDQAQQSEISFVARFQEAEAESSSVLVSTNPTLIGLRLVGTSAGANIPIGHELIVDITGSDLAGRRAAVEILRKSNGAPDEVVRTDTVAFDEALDIQTARFSWTVDGRFAERPGINELFLRVIYQSQMLESDSVFLDVRTRVGPLTVSRRTADGLRSVGSDPLPYFETLTLTVDVPHLDTDFDAFRVHRLVANEDDAPPSPGSGKVGQKSRRTPALEGTGDIASGKRRVAGQVLLFEKFRQGGDFHPHALVDADFERLPRVIAAQLFEHPERFQRVARADLHSTP